MSGPNKIRVSEGTARQSLLHRILVKNQNRQTDIMAGNHITAFNHSVNESIVLINSIVQYLNDQQIGPIVEFRAALVLYANNVVAIHNFPQSVLETRLQHEIQIMNRMREYMIGDQYPERLLVFNAIRTYMRFNGNLIDFGDIPSSPDSEAGQ